MAYYKLPSHDNLRDQQLVDVRGPDGTTQAFFYDQNARTLYRRDGEILIPPFHGTTHIASDLVPVATTDLQGHMSADDKVKLDSLCETRVGVLGFQGDGFPDDGGWLKGDIILAAGTEFISLERIGNVIRFTVDSPLPLNCGCEECATIYWIQDETDTNSIRPPACAGVIPGINSYGEVKAYLLPESAIVDPAKPQDVLNTKHNYPAMVFKRYDDATTPGSAEFHLILKRNANLTTQVGYSMTPGQVDGTVETVLFTGLDDEGNQIRFDFKPDLDADMLGVLTYKGHSLTRRMAAIIDYTSEILTTNQYQVKFWDIQNAAVIGDQFVATNLWKYENPENRSDDLTNPKTMVTDQTKDILSIGTLVQIWSFQVGVDCDNNPIMRNYFNFEPHLNPEHLWASVDSIQFGDTFTIRDETGEVTLVGTDEAEEDISDFRVAERTQWGITGFEDRLYLEDNVLTPINNRYEATIDEDIPGMVVEEADLGTDPGTQRERPIFLWHRSQHKNTLSRFKIGMPLDGRFPPYDILLRAPIDRYTDVYAQVIDRGTLSGGDLDGCRWIWLDDEWGNWPKKGAVRILTDDMRNFVWKYDVKMLHSSGGFGRGVALVNCAGVEFPADPGSIVVVELLHYDFQAPCVRCEFSVVDDTNTQAVQLQFLVGTLDMKKIYELDESTDPSDDFVRGMSDYVVSRIYTQDGFLSDDSGSVVSDPAGFICYEGGKNTSGEEFFNKLEIMHRDDQVWIWWNDLLIPPDPILTAALETPMVVTSPYFPLETDLPFGKVGMRLWPGSIIRSIELKAQIEQFSEFQHSQLEISS